jgi:zinc protease
MQGMMFRSPRLRLVLLLVAIVSVSTPERLNADPQSGQWAHQNSSLKPDSRVVWGGFENGFRYAVLPHDGVPGRVSIQLLVLAGSLDEKDDEQGIAHFIEHMAFNGTRNFEASEMTSFFQDLGMDFGSDVNAMTTLDHTVYTLEFQENNEDLLRRGFTLFRDFADGIRFEQIEIEKERGVILSELRANDGFEYRMSNASKSFFFSGLAFPERNPIGLPSILNSLNQDDFLEYYRRMYRPDLMVFVASGDFASDQLIGMIGEFFGDLPQPTSRIPERNLGRLDKGRGLRASVFEISHVGSGSVQVASIAADREATDSVAARKRWHDRKLAASLLTNRMRRMIPQSGGAAASVERIVGYTASLAGLTVPGGLGWRDGLLSLDQVIRLTKDEGFQAKEAEWTTKRQIMDIEKLRAQYSKLDPGVISSAIVRSITEDEVFIGLEADLAMREGFLRNLDIGDVNRAFRESWDMDNLAYHLGGEVAVKGGPDEIVEDIKRHRKGGISYITMQQKLEKPFELKDWGPVGKVVERETVPEFEATLMRFSNGIRLNFVESRQEPSVVRAVVRVGGGLFDLKGNRMAIRDFALETVLRSGTTHYQAEDIGSVVGSVMLEFSFDLEDHDAFTFRGAFGSEDLDTFLGIVTEFLYKPRFSRSTFNGAMMGAIRNRQSSIMGLQDGFRKLDNHLYRTDARFAWGGPMDYASLGVSDVRKWLQEPLTAGYVEATIVGDIPEELAVQSFSRTLGSLSERAPEKKTGFVRPVSIAAKPGFQRIEFVGEEYQAAAVGIWPIDDKLSLSDRANLSVLGRILEIRIRNEIREDLGLAYSPRTEFKPYPEYSKFALIRAMIDCSPKEAESIARKVERIAVEMAEEGISQAEFEGALGPFVGHVRQELNTNEFLINSVLLRAQEEPKSLEEAIEMKTNLREQVSLEQVEAFAKTVFAEDNTRIAAIVPKPFVGVFQIEEGGSAGEEVLGRGL